MNCTQKGLKSEADILKRCLDATKLPRIFHGRKEVIHALNFDISPKEGTIIRK